MGKRTTRSEKIKKGVDINHVKQRYLFLMTIIACAMLLLGNDVILAREDEEPKPPTSFEEQSLRQDEQEPIKGYPERKRRIGGPTDVEWDLDNSFPKRGSVLELILRCPEN